MHEAKDRQSAVGKPVERPGARAEQPAIVGLGLGTYLEPLSVIAQGARLLASYRLNQPRLDAFVRKVREVLEVHRRIQAPPSDGRRG